MRNRVAFALLAAWGLLSPFGFPLLAADLQVNTEVEGNQSHSDIAISPGGEVMVVWHSSNRNPDLDTVHARVYGADGAPLGAQFQISEPNLRGYDPAVASLGGGHFVAAWQSGNQYIRARRYDAAGAPLGPYFDASADGFALQEYAYIDAAAGADGRFAIEWVGANRLVAIQRYSADGSPAGPRISAFAGVEEIQDLPSLGFDQAGNFALAYLSRSGPNSLDSKVWLQRYTANGTPADSRIQVAAAHDWWVVGSKASLVVKPDGSMLVAWTEQNIFNFVNQPLAQLYSAAGEPLGGRLELHSQGSEVDAAADGAGNVMVAMAVQGFIFNEFKGIVGRRIRADGALEGRVQISTTFAQQGLVSFAMKPSGEFVAAWTEVEADGVDPTLQDILRSEINRGEVFADGFESGDTAGWSQAVP